MNTLEALYNAYYAKLLKYVFKYTNNYQDAEDIVSTTFLFFQQRLINGTLDSSVKLETGVLFRKAKQCVVDWLRKNHKKYTAKNNACYARRFVSFDYLVDECNCQFEEKKDNSHFDKIYSVIQNSLSKKEFEVFNLVLNQYSFASIARKFNVNTSTVSRWWNYKIQPKISLSLENIGVLQTCS